MAHYDITYNVRTLIIRRTISSIFRHMLCPLRKLRMFRYILCSMLRCWTTHSFECIICFCLRIVCCEIILTTVYQIYVKEFKDTFKGKKICGNFYFIHFLFGLWFINSTKRVLDITHHATNYPSLLPPISHRPVSLLIP